MKLMIEKEERYKSYESTGGEPEDRPNNQIGAPPPAPPSDVENEDSNTAQIEQPPTSSTDKKIDDLKSGKESLLFWLYLCDTENFVQSSRHCIFSKSRSIASTCQKFILLFQIRIKFFLFYASYNFIRSYMFAKSN